MCAVVLVLEYFPSLFLYEQASPFTTKGGTFRSTASLHTRQDPPNHLTITRFLFDIRLSCRPPELRHRPILRVGARSRSCCLVSERLI